MKKRQTVTVLLLSALALAGCAKTPEQAVVREKGDRGVEGYREETESSETNALAQKLQVPDVYEQSLVSDDGKFKLECSADIFVPDVAKVPIYQVTQKDFSQELIDRVTKTFFGDAPVYDAEYLYGRTKADIEVKLNELKGYMAEGNLDPYGVIARLIEQGVSEDEAKQEYDLQAQIDAWEEAYINAPEEKEKKEVQPGFSDTAQDDAGTNSSDYFAGYVETENGSYFYQLQTWSAEPINIRISRLDRENMDSNTGELEYREVIGLWDQEKTDASLTEEEQKERLGEQTGLTKEEAVAQTDRYLESLGLLDAFSCKDVVLARGSWEGGGEWDDQPDMHVSCYGWQVIYTRDIDGFPVTYEVNKGGALESMESTIEPWRYETVQITVNKDGLLFVDIENLYDVGEKRMENVQLLPFPEIAGIFEQMIQIQNAQMEYTLENKIHISHVSLGYMRIYDPTVENHAGTLVPVWDFFGSEEVAGAYEGESYQFVNSFANESFLTVNAADGTVIDRGLGY